ncbi:MAG TPA: response regulator [Anaerolineales bacterium]|nr:response regulator [Anaerolineales bacterium]
MPRVLVVEDNVDNFELVRFLLERAGHETRWARSGREGILMAKAEKPDLILMDLSLPEIDGWTATERIKSDPETRHIPIAALTAHTLPGDRKRALEAGCDGYLSKPLSITLLTDTVADLIAKSNASSAHPPKPGPEGPSE